MQVPWHEALGLAEDATLDDVEERVQELRQWLKQVDAPRQLRPWLRRQKALVEAAYQAYHSSIDTEMEETVEAEEEAEQERPRPVARRSRRRGPPRRSPARGGLRSPLAWVGVGVAVGLVALGLVLWLGGFVGGEKTAGLVGDTSGQTASGPQFLAQHQARVAELEAKVAANPSDAASLFELGETHIIGEDWAKAIFWFERLLLVEPGNVHAMTDIGTANYNLGQYPQALESWQKALAAAPDDTQVHYDLGYFYAFSPMTDYSRAEAHWKEVLRLEPTSPLAETIRVHLDQIKGLSAAAATTTATR